MSDALKLDRYQYRSATWDDLSAIADLRNASSQSTRGKDVTAGHWQKRFWYDSGINLETDSLLVFDGETAVAYVEVSSEYPFVLYEMVGAVHPAYRHQGLGTKLVHWVKNRVRQTMDKAPEGTAVFIHNSLFDSNEPGRTLLAGHGYADVRDFVYLQIFMDSIPAELLLPEGIQIRPLQSADWSKLGPALDEAFQDHWAVVEYDVDEPEDEGGQNKPNPRETDPEAFDSAYFNSPGFCFVGWDGDEVVGAALCNETTVEYPGSGYLGSLSIRPRWRRLGIGRALTLHALRAFYHHGITHVLTDTDGDSLTAAYRVYQKAGMSIFRREHVYQKCVRPGQDLLKRKMP